MTITLTREEAQQVHDALLNFEGDISDAMFDALTTLRTRLSAPEPEPVADKYLMEVECTKCGAKQDGILTVNAPPQREWQGLADEEISELIRNTHNTGSFVRAIEAKLKEKNT